MKKCRELNLLPSTDLYARIEALAERRHGKGASVTAFAERLLESAVESFEAAYKNVEAAQRHIKLPDEVSPIVGVSPRIIS